MVKQISILRVSFLIFLVLATPALGKKRLQTRVRTMHMATLEKLPAQKKYYQSVGALIKQKQRGQLIDSGFSWQGVPISVKSGAVSHDASPVVGLISSGYGGAYPFVGLPKGHGPAGGIHAGGDYVANNIVHEPCVVFDYPDYKRKLCNWSGPLNVNTFTRAYEKTVEKNPDKKIVVYTKCRGTAPVLKAMATQPEQFENVDALIIESPLASLRALADMMGKNYVHWLPKSNKIIYKVLKAYFPNVSKKDTMKWDVVHKMPPKKIFIGHLINDKVISSGHVVHLVNECRKAGHEVYFTAIKDKKLSHAQLSQNKTYQSQVNTFKKAAGLPYDESCIHNYEATLAHLQDAAANPCKYV